ncbi:carbohydrate ABC transporter permease [Paenibacillus sp. YIM B09110]|uniref:carbohydrate ABC transporter permease n=1 Tax=Paenibacillus sp. YIM B09110 TaxID=3126102 RepID=UPI00301DF8B4
MNLFSRKKLKAFDVFNGLFLTAAVLLCVLPFVHILAVSLSSSTAATKGVVTFWPVEFNLYAYKFVLGRVDFWRAMYVSLERILIAVPICMLLTVLVAYPLSKDHSILKSRSAYVWFFFFTTIFNGGLIPTYFIVKETGLMDSVWSLVLPGAVPVFNIIVLLNFFRQLPKEMDEAAVMDGAGHWTVLWKIYVPTSMPSLATLLLFVIVFHWNSWFDGMIYMNDPMHFPMQTYLRTVVTMPDLRNVTLEDLENLKNLSERTVKASQILVGALPVLITYPFLQRYFVKGMVIGSVKG